MASTRSLSAVVELNPHFVRSVRLDADYGREDALQGYMLQAGTRSVLENMARQIVDSRQRAFTWTGPYGGGKSSLGLVLASLIGPDAKLRRFARSLLKIKVGEPLAKAFAPGSNGWLVLPVVGRRASVETEIAATIERLTPKRRGRPPANQRTSGVIADLTRLAQTKNAPGVLLILDELGKFLESAAATGDDIHFYQELAEAASRCSGKLVVVGILHQAFDQYAHRLGRDAREEWAKVQGRYVDIPVVSAADEILALIGNAIQTRGFKHSWTDRVAKTIGEAILSRRPGTPLDLWQRLNACWPLHPVTAALLGPSAKRRFGQNERSIFGFLNSAEPLGFKEFLEGNEASGDRFYWPAQYWDYLRANLEPAILASSDGHRWAQAAEAVERAEARYRHLHVALVKTIGLIELFRNGTGLVAANDVLHMSVAGASAEEVDSALAELAKATIVVYRKHLDAWGVYAGSDFDIDAAIGSARSESVEADLAGLARISELLPISAKRLYRETGALRWFTCNIVSATDSERYLADFKRREGSSGEFVLLVPAKGTTARAAEGHARRLSTDSNAQGVVVGCATNGDRIGDLASELTALERVAATRSELEGDSVARREVQARLLALHSDLEEELRDSFVGARWFYQGEKADSDARLGLAPLASRIAATLFPQAPHFFSELVNRDNPSSNSVKARRDLMYRMLRYSTSPDLGYVAFPADAGLYFTILKSAGLHREIDGQWRFCAPPLEGRGSSLQHIWDSTLTRVAVPGTTTSLSNLYQVWASPPYGVKRGVMPILALAFFLANRQNLALYIDGLFVPDLTEAQVDEWLQDPSRIGWRFVHIEVSEKRMLSALAQALTLRLRRKVVSQPLDSARALVSLAFELPPWTRRTATVSVQAQTIRQLLLKASDPHKVLFNDLPQVLKRDATPEMAAEIASTMAELTDAYPTMLRRIEGILLHSLDHSADLKALCRRGETVRGIVGDFKLDAFAGRIAQYDGSESAIEGLISLAVQKPGRDWTDRDIDAAILQLGAWALEFRRDETLAPMRDRPATRRAIAVVFGVGRKGKTVSDSFDVGEADLPAIAHLVKRILAQIPAASVKREIFLAALAEAGARVVEEAAAKEAQ